MGPTAYEIQRLKNIESNRALLVGLGLDEPLFQTKEKPKKLKAAPRKRKGIVADTVDDAEGRPSKTARTSPPGPDSEGPRRSQRNVGKSIDYKSENNVSYARLVSLKHDDPTGDSDPRRLEKRVHNPKVFGHITGIEVGTWWEMRKDCSEDAVHAPWVAGISGSNQGAYSVALSGGYEDDVDLGYAFTYTGSGGRDLKGTKDAPKNLRTAPQSSDQTFENSYNKALQVSCKTKKPIRVIRGFKLKSEYAPSEGYRYDGLYTVEKAWTEKGLNPKGYLVCKFAFKRLPGQPPIPVRDLTESKQADGGAGTSDANTGDEDDKDAEPSDVESCDSEEGMTGEEDAEGVSDDSEHDG